jgi:hypothetical protein
MEQTSNERIRTRAYELFLQRGAQPGDALRDWLTAEAEIRDEIVRHRGPAKLRDVSHHGKITGSDGSDIENPT